MMTGVWCDRVGARRRGCVLKCSDTLLQPHHGLHSRPNLQSACVGTRDEIEARNWARIRMMMRNRREEAAGQS